MEQGKANDVSMSSRRKDQHVLRGAAVNESADDDWLWDQLVESVWNREGENMPVSVVVIVASRICYVEVTQAALS